MLVLAVVVAVVVAEARSNCLYQKDLVFTIRISGYYGGNGGGGQGERFFYWREPVIIFCISGYNGRRVETGAYAEIGDHGVRIGIYRKEY